MALCAAMLTLPYRVGSNDLWIQIATGRYILQHGIPWTDPFSFTAGDHRYIEHEWVTTVLFALVWQAGGVAGLMVLKGLLVGATYALTLRTAQALGASLGGMTCTFPALVFVFTSRVTERPHIVSSLGLALYTYLLCRVRAGHLHARWLWVIPLVHLVWSNMHAGHVQGLALLALVGLGDVVQWRVTRGRWGAPWPRLGLQILLLVPVCLVASLLNPYGVALLAYPVREAALEQALGWNTEWLPLWRTWGGQFAVGVYLAGLLLLGWRLGQAIRTHQPVDYPLMGLVLANVGLAFRYSRAMPDSAMLVVLLLTTLPTRSAWHLQRPWALRVGVGLTLALTSYVVVYGYPCCVRPPALAQIGGTRTGVPPLPLVGHRPLGFGILGVNLPLCAVAFLAQHGLTGRAFVPMGGAEWLVFQVWPRFRVSNDSRLHLYGPELLTATAEAVAEPAALAAYLQRWRPTLLLVQHFRLSLPVYHYLVEQGWMWVFMDDKWAILVPPQRWAAALIQATGYTTILPWRNLPVVPANAETVVHEADQALAACPDGATFAWAYKAQALRLLGRHEEAFMASLNVPKYLVIK
jgi:hypothetical protein